MEATARNIDYGTHVDCMGFERQLDKELDQVLTWICSVTDMDRTEALAAMRQTMQSL